MFSDNHKNDFSGTLLCQYVLPIIRITGKYEDKLKFRFTLSLIARVTLRQVLSITTCGALTHIKVGTYE